MPHLRLQQVRLSRAVPPWSFPGGTEPCAQSDSAKARTDACMAAFAEGAALAVVTFEQALERAHSDLSVITL